MHAALNALILFITVIVGYFVALSIKTNKPHILQLLLTFSGAFSFAVAIFDLLPALYSGDGDHHDMGIWIMSGFLLQLLLELLSKGVEHGHKHIDGLPKGKAPFAVLLGLYLHAFLEAMPIGAYQNSQTAASLTRAIALHSLPITIVFYSLTKSLNLSKIFGFLLILGFAVMGPLGIALAGNVAELRSAERELTALTMGVFLHISTTILFESAKGHAFNVMKFGSIVLAILMAWFGHSHGHS